MSRDIHPQHSIVFAAKRKRENPIKQEKGRNGAREKKEIMLPVFGDSCPPEELNASQLCRANLGFGLGLHVVVLILGWLRLRLDLLGVNFCMKSKVQSVFAFHIWREIWECCMY